jgi:hypothetical protein
VFIMLGYSFDYGRCAQGGHRGDSERVALDLEITASMPARPELADYPGEGWTISVTRFYTAAHEGTSTDASRISSPAEVEGDLDITGARWRIYAGRAKHGSFPTRASCQTAADGICTMEDCQSYHLLLFPIVNAGEPDMPSGIALPFPGESIWSEAPFCGGIASGDLPCATTARRKLIDDPFAP